MILRCFLLLIVPFICFGHGRPHSDIVVKNKMNSGKVSEEELITAHSYLSLCCVAKDEPDIREWVEYHHDMGVGKFYLFDNNSSIPLINYIQDYVASGLVEYSVFTHLSYPDMLKEHQTGQVYIFDKCLQDFGHRHTFMGFIDSDEYINVVNKSLSIIDILKSYESYGALTLNWMMFGTSGHVTRPTGGVLASYSKCYATYTVKALVNTNYTIASNRQNPHQFLYSNGKKAVDTNLHIVSSAHNPPGYVDPPMNSTLFKVIYINHYNTRSEEDFKSKVSRGRFNLKIHPVNYTAQIDALCVHACPLLKRPKVPFKTYV